MPRYLPQAVQINNCDAVRDATGTLNIGKGSKMLTVGDEINVRHAAFDRVLPPLNVPRCPATGPIFPAEPACALISVRCTHCASSLLRV